MSAKPWPAVVATWLVPTERRQEVMIISQPTFWISHWDVNERRTRRCGGAACLMCASGCPKVLRAVIMVIDGSGRDRLLELRERHRSALESYDTLVGLRIRLRKTGPAKNSPVEVTALDYAHAVERDITRLVESFGLAPICVADFGEVVDSVFDLPGNLPRD